MFQVVNRCFQIMQTRTEESWRRDSDLVIVPDVRGIEWDGFDCGPEMMKAGEAAATARPAEDSRMALADPPRYASCPE